MASSEDRGGAFAEGGAIDRAIRQHDRALVRWLARKFGDVETARDIAQSAYLRVCRYAQAQSVDDVPALIFKTAANLASNELRARRRIQRLKLDLSAPLTDERIEQIAGVTPSPEAAAAAREEVAALLTAIISLPEHARHAFVLSRFEDKTYREIAATLGVSESSVEKYIIAALKALREAVAETGGPRVVHLPNLRGKRVRE